MHRHPRTHIRPRNRFVFALARGFGVWGFRLWCRPHLEIDPGLPGAAAEGGVFLYAALHKSLWETTGIQVALSLSGMEVPWVGMGDNLVRGRFFQGLVERAGGFLIRRPRNRRDLIVSARQLRDSVLALLETRRSVLVFPEGTRRSVPDRRCHGPFFPAVFAAVLEYARDSRRSDGTLPPVFIVPVNVDYSKVREDHEMLHRRKGPLTLHVTDSLKMIRYIGDVYISYGAPMPVSRMIGLDRRGLAEQVRGACLDLVKILPVNVVAGAILRMEKQGGMDPLRLPGAVAQVVDELRPRADRFRGFSLRDEAEEIIRLAARSNNLFKDISPKLLPGYRLYADYIGHYFPERDGE